MAEEIKVKITRRVRIKPFSPTPQHMRIVKLSRLDQIAPGMYIPLILYYPFITNSKDYSHNRKQNPIQIACERVQRLRETLRKALALYYPFAGRLRNNLFVESNDEGATFVEAKAAFPMSRVLKNPDPVALKGFLGAEPESTPESNGGSLLIVQATIFLCGGISLAFSFSHKIADACTAGGFIRSWARTARENPDNPAKPEFGKGCDIFPPEHSSSSEAAVPSGELAQEKCVTARLVFTAESIAALKSTLKGDPTAYEAVSGLLWRSAMKASATWTSLLFMPLNMRKRMSPPLGDHVVGNLIAGTMARTEREGLSVQELVDKVRETVREAAGSYSDAGRIPGTVPRGLEEAQEAMMNQSDEAEFYGCSSWRRLGFYEADFGWEKPAWVSIVSTAYRNVAILMDTKDGYGTEAWLGFKEQDMAFLLTDPDLLAFASINPSLI